MNNLIYHKSNYDHLK